MKTIYLEPEEEIVSVIDRLAQTKSREVSLVVPAGAQIWQNPINLRLLKRESDNLGKEITLFVPDDLKAEVAEKVGFSVKKDKNPPFELIREEKEEPITEEKGSIQPEKDMIGLLVEELKPDEKEEVDYLLAERPVEEKPLPEEKVSLVGRKYEQPEKKSFRWPGSRGSQPHKKMVDIVRPGGQDGLLQPIRSKIKSVEEIPKRFFPGQFLKKRPKESLPRLEPSKTKPIIRKKVWRGTKDFETITRPSRWPKFLALFIILSFLTAGLVAYLALPTTEIEITLKKEKVVFDLVVVGSKNISQADQNLNEIPLEEIKVEKTKSKEFPATGEKELDEKASGRITIYNEYSSSPQILVATTRFESPEGKVFRILETVTVPGAEIVEGKIVPNILEVTVVADQSGAAYNIGPTNFTIPGFKGTPKYAGFYAKSTSPMSGGYVGVAKVVSAEDLDKAEKDLAKELKEEVKQTLQEQIPTDLKPVEDGLKEEITKISTVEEGDEGETFDVEMKAVTQALFFRETDLKKLVDLNLISQVEENKAPLSETQQINYEEIAINWSAGEVDFDLRVDEEVVWQIDLGRLKQDLAGQTEVEVRKYLANQPEIEKAKVTFWPFWVKRIPLQEKKIEITID
jgi:hypothetical protein